MVFKALLYTTYTMQNKPRFSLKIYMHLLIYLYIYKYKISIKC
jgi:hypothetical protein